MDKDDLGRMYARFIEDADESLLTVMADDFRDHVSGQRGTAIWLTVKDWVDRSFADRTVETRGVAAGAHLPGGRRRSRLVIAR